MSRFVLDSRILVVVFVSCIVVTFFAVVYLVSRPAVNATDFDKTYPIGRKITVAWIARDMTFTDYDMMLEIQHEFIEYKWNWHRENWVGAGNSWDGWKTEFYARRVG